MSGPLSTTVIRDAAREVLRKSNPKMHIPGPPFQFAVRTDKSMMAQDQTALFPHYDAMKTRITLVPSFTTETLPQSRKEVLKLYRRVCRRIPGILQDYNAWHISERNARNKVRDEFLKNAQVRDTRVIDKLRIKGEQELQNYHWGRYHTNTVYRFLAPEEQYNPVPDIVKKKQNFSDSKFLTDFFTGPDAIDK